jgi:hypothetical protein
MDVTLLHEQSPDYLLALELRLPLRVVEKRQVGL